MLMLMLTCSYESVFLERLEIKSMSSEIQRDTERGREIQRVTESGSVE